MYAEKAVLLHTTCFTCSSAELSILVLLKKNVHSFLFFSKRFKKFDWAESTVSRGIHSLVCEPSAALAANAGTTWWVFC